MEQYVIGPGLITSLDNILIISKRQQKIQVIYSSGEKLCSAFDSEEKAKLQFDIICRDLQKTYILIHPNDLVLKSRIDRISHSPRTKGLFCIKTIGESAIIEFKLSFLRWSYHFDTEQDAIMWIDDLTKILKK